jgi:hypothetical protein
MTVDTMLSGQLSNIVNIICAAGALGTAAFGLVDSSKAFAGGISNAGFSYVKNTVDPFILGAVTPAFGKPQILETLRANWLNGMAKADQKAVAKSLIRLSLTMGNAAALATATGVDETQLSATVKKIHKGDSLLPTDLNILGQFDAVVSARLDAGYERADQMYRNASKCLAAVVAIVLAAVAGGLIFLSGQSALSVGDYLSSSTFVLAILVGAVSTPLAPIAKDLASSLQAAASAVSAAKRPSR